jgi:carboxylesterase type B
MPSIRLAEAASAHHSATYMYRMSYGGRMGAVHGLDVPVMWDTMDAIPGMMSQAFGVDEPPQALATAMHGAWANFIKSGRPQHTSLPEWRSFDTTRRATMDLNTQSQVIDDPIRERRKLWTNTSY